MGFGLKIKHAPSIEQDTELGTTALQDQVSRIKQQANELSNREWYSTVVTVRT